MAEKKSKKGPIKVHLVRHASAGHRDNSNPFDSDRKLDEKGHTQAHRLIAELADANIKTIVSSPLIRCVQTVEPIANHLGLEVETNKRFAELTPTDKAWRALESLTTGLEKSGSKHSRSIVVCSHGDIIPDLLRVAVMRGTRVIGRSGGAKGSIWTLTGWDGVTFTTAQYKSQKDFSAGSA